MKNALHSAAEIMVFSNDAGDAALVRKLLEPEFDNVQASFHPDRHVETYDKRPAEVLILAFDSLEASERHYLALYRGSQKIHLKPHRTIILCNKEDVRRAYELCRKDLFDDYMLFWPLTHDTPRLLMSVHLALRELAAMRDTAPTATEFAAQARHMAALETMVSQHLAQGDARIQSTMQAVSQAEQQVEAALEGFTRRITDGSVATGITPQGIPALKQEMERVQRDEIHKPLRAVGNALAPLGQWAQQLRKELDPHIETARSLTAMAERVKPTLLIVDDDEVQRKMVATLLKAENYKLLFAVNGLDALGLLRKVRPDLILMDIKMPGFDGLETTRRLKSVPSLLNVPVIMVTGISEGNVVIDSLRAGATAFVVKPFDRPTLLGKIAKVLQTRREAGAEA